MTDHELSKLQEILSRRALVEALAYLTSLDQQGPNRASVQYHLGFVNRRLKKFDEAVRHYEEAIRLEPLTPAFFLGLGIAFQQQGNYKAALRGVERAIELQPDYANAWNSLGLTHKMAGDPQSALAAYERAQELLVAAASAKVKVRRPEVIQTQLCESGEKGMLLTSQYFGEVKQALAS